MKNIKTKEDFWIEISKCNLDKDKILSVLMDTIALMLPTKKHLEERTKPWDLIAEKTKQLKANRDKHSKEIAKLKEL